MLTEKAASIIEIISGNPFQYKTVGISANQSYMSCAFKKDSENARRKSV